MLVATTTHAKAIKGAIVGVKDEPAVWGTKEGLPNYVIVTISNATMAQVGNYLDPWKSDFQHAVVTLPGGEKEITVTITAQFMAAFGAGLKAKMKTYLEDEWLATFTSYVPTQAVFEVPSGTDLAELKSSILDIFEDWFPFRWIFDPAEVDIVIGLGGFVTVTKAQATDRIIDRTA